MLDPRLYRVAFVPVLLALLVAAFSLQDRPRPIGTTLPADAFDGIRAQDTLADLAARYPARRAGSAADARMADDLAQRFKRLVPGGTVEEHRYRGETIDGERDLVDVIATRPGVPGPGIVVVAHRDAVGSPAKAELSATAALLELARLGADGRLRRTITFISTTGGSGGFAGAREEARRLGGRADAVLVLGDVAASDARRPFVVSFSDGKRQAPIQLTRTVEASVRREVGADAGGARAWTQWARLAVPVTIGEQGAFLRAGQPAVLLSGSGERPPAADASLSDARMLRFGRAALRVLYALDNFRDFAAPPTNALSLRGKVLPGWAIRMLVGALLLPPLVMSFDAFARLRRRREPVGRWASWTLTAAIPFILACLAAVLLGAVGAVSVAPRAPIPPAGLHVGAGPIATLAALGVVFVAAWVLVRPIALRAIAARVTRTDAPTALGGPGSAVGVTLIACVVTLALWLANPYAAALLIPALHVWPWVTTPDVRIPRVAAVAAVILALFPMAAVAVMDTRAFGLSLGEAVWFWPLLVVGRHVPVGAWMLWSLVAGCAVAAALVAARRTGPPDQEPEDETVRGPIGYAGPGSLGGTESALRLRR
jgi:hypothetical protein